MIVSIKFISEIINVVPSSKFYKIVSTYINLGWNKFQNFYSSTKHVSKIKIIDNKSQPDIFYRSVDVFAASRGYGVQYYFDCSSEKYGPRASFKTFGSTNLIFLL